MSLLAKTHDLHKPEFTCLARKSDPETSIAAGRKVEREGTVARHERLICEALAKYGPMTAKEMEVPTGLSSVEISRRSGGLMNNSYENSIYHEYKTIKRKKLCQYTGTRNGFKVWELIP